MTTDTQDFSQLRASADAATPEMKAWFELDDKGWCIAGEAYDAQAFIAVANPASITALLDALEALQADLLLHKNALWKACGDDKETVNEYLDSQRDGPDCTPNHLCKGRMVHLPRGEHCDQCGETP